MSGRGTLPDAVVLVKRFVDDLCAFVDLAGDAAQRSKVSEDDRDWELFKELCGDLEESLAASKRIMWYIEELRSSPHWIANDATNR